MTLFLNLSRKKVKKGYPLVLSALLFLVSFCFFPGKISFAQFEFAQEKDSPAYYIGNRKCMICHPLHFERWHEDKHAGAFDYLGKMHKNPYCIKCHTTGYGKKGGYVNAEVSPQMAGVQCEACHGPGSEHKIVPNDKKRLNIKTSIDYENTCKECHNKDWDPKFKYEEYRKKIEHRLEGKF